MANTKTTTTTAKIQPKVEPNGFIIQSTATINPKLNEKLEEKIGVVLKDVNGLKTINEYFKVLIDTKIMPNKDNFKTIHALLAQVEENIEMPEKRPLKHNMSIIIKNELMKEPSIDDDSIIKNSSFYSDWKTPKSNINIENKTKQLETSHKQRRAISFVRKTQLDLKTMLNTINLKKDQFDQIHTLKENQLLEAQKSSKDKINAHKKEQIVSHMKRIKKQKVKRLKILKEANKKYEEMKTKLTLHEKMETAYSKKLERTIKSAKIEKKKLFKPWDYEKLKEHEVQVTKSFKERMNKIDEIKKSDSIATLQIVKDTSKLDLIKKQKEFAKLVQVKYRPTTFAENSIEDELQRIEYEKELQREEFMTRIRENQERSKNYLQESLCNIVRDPKKPSDYDKENKYGVKTLKNYLPEITRGLKKKVSESLDKVLTKPINHTTLPAIITDISKYESLSKSKLMDVGRGSISRKEVEAKEALYKDVIGAKLNLLNKMNG